ncbi:MAG: hypothetical protein IJ797_08645 [Selenomonadaceae bacterium]|nr:hypothetical protein [Selenomonadaceae bacterium]
MSFRYVNPGFAELIEALTNKGTVTNNIYNPINSVAFYSTNDQNNTQPSCMLLANTPNQLYVRFDIYCGTNNFAFYLMENRNTYDYYKFGVWGYSPIIFYYGGASKEIARTSVNWDDIGVNHIWFHLDFTNFTGEIVINGVYKSYSFSQSNLAGRRVKVRGNSNCYFSNIIISDEYIDPKEEVVMLPTSGVSTDMAANQDGTYTADSAGQSVLHTVDASTLITNYGGESQVTGIAPLAVPAYRTAQGLCNLISIDKISGSLTTHNTVEVSTDSDSAVCDCWKPSNLTLSGLHGKQLGWQAAM